MFYYIVQIVIAVNGQILKEYTFYLVTLTHD